VSRTALVTGASRGIGRALVKALAARDVVVLASGRDEAKLQSLQNETGCLIYALDLGTREAPRELYARAKDALGTVDIVVNNAGYNSRKALFVDTDLEEFEAQYALNLRAPAELCRLALKDMIERKSGHIVNVLSTATLYASEQMGIYTAMKHGLTGLTKVLIKEARPHGVKVSAVHPGGTNTEFRATERPDYMRPESVAELIVHSVLFAPDDAVVHELVFRPMVETNF